MAKDLIVGVPTLHSISNPVLTKKEDIVAYLIQFFFVNPGNTSSRNEGEMVSFRKLLANYGDASREEMATKIGDMLTACAQHYFPTADLNFACQIEEEQGFNETGDRLLGTYGIAISCKDSDGNSVCPFSKFEVAKDGSTFKAIY